MIAEHDSVQLLKRLPSERLEAGDVGVVVHVHGRGEAYEVEFMTFSGHTVAVCTLGAEDVRHRDDRSIPHVRHLVV